MPNRIMLPQYWHSEPYSPTELKYETILKHLPLGDGDIESAGGVVQHYRDWLTHADGEVEAFIRAEVLKLFPDDHVMGEEEGGESGAPVFTSNLP